MSLMGTHGDPGTWGIAEMEIRVLDCHGSQFPGCGLAGLLIRGRTLLNAGSAAAALTPEERSGVDRVLINHAHLDHIPELPCLADHLCCIRKRDPLMVIGTPG